MTGPSGGVRRLVASGATAAVMLGALAGAGCADETTGGDEAGGGTDEVRQHLESLDTAYAEGSTSAVESHLRALDNAWEDASGDVDNSDEVQGLLDTLESQVDEQAPPEEVSTTIEDIDQALGA